MYGVIRKIRQFNLPVVCQLDLFDKMVLPVLLYGCEIWGFENLDIIERVHLKFLKHILYLKSSTPNYMVYGETGRFPLSVIIYSRIVSYWCKLLNSTDKKISCILYQYLIANSQYEIVKNPWIDCVHRIFDSCGLSHIWNEQFYYHLNQDWVTAVVKQRLQDQFIQKWYSDINSSSKGILYKTFKTNFEYENYLSILPLKFRKILVKFRTTNHRLPVELGRWTGIPLNERLCTLCDAKHVADEFHFILECNALSKIRKKYINEYYFTRPNILKFSQLMTKQDAMSLKKLCMFISKIYDLVCPP